MNEKRITAIVLSFTVIVVALVSILFFLPAYNGDLGFDVRILPMLNAIFNSFTFVTLLIAFISIKQKNIKRHRTFIWCAFGSTTLFLITYVTYHYLTESTSYGGEGFWKYVYLFILITHIILAAIVVPLALFSLVRGINNQVEKHRRIARWTMPIWLYVSLTGVIVYLMISPYY